MLELSRQLAQAPLFALARSWPQPAATGSIGTHGSSGSGRQARAVGERGRTGAAGATSTGTAGATSTGARGRRRNRRSGRSDAPAWPATASLNAGLTPARRLTRDQFNNTVRDLLGATGTPADALAPTRRSVRSTATRSRPSTPRWCSSIRRWRRRWPPPPRRAWPRSRPAISTSDTGTSTTCATRFVTEFGQRAFRRPLDTAEVQSYVVALHAGQDRATAWRTGSAWSSRRCCSRRSSFITTTSARPARRRRGPSRSRRTSWRRGCRTSSGTRCPTTRCSRAPRTGRSPPIPC